MKRAHACFGSAHALCSNSAEKVLWQGAHAVGLCECVHNGEARGAFCLFSDMLR